MRIDYLTNQICDEIRRGGSEPDVVATVIDVLVNEGIDIRREPSLNEMKQILVEAFRASEQTAVAAF